MCEMFLNDLDCYPGGLGTCAENLQTLFFLKKKQHFAMLKNVFCHYILQH